MTANDAETREHLDCEVATLIAMARAELKTLCDELGGSASANGCHGPRSH